jgi:hypothetical protein
MVNTYFMLAHNILPLKACLAAMGAGDGLCERCGVPEDTRHLFQQYPRVADLWDGLYSRLARELPAVPSDWELLLLDFEAASPLQERLVVAHLGTFVAEVWGARHCLRPVSRHEVAAAFRAFFPGLRPSF